MRVFITGLTGTLGTALARLHAERGDTVFGCSRSEERARAWLAEHGRTGTLFLCDAASLADPEMTRYFLPVREAAEFLASDLHRGKVCLPVGMKAAAMGPLANAVARGRTRVVAVGRRAGETQHQWLAAPGDGLVRNGNDPERHSFLSSDGALLKDGLSSETAPRWEPAALLREAGITV